MNKRDFLKLVSLILLGLAHTSCSDSDSSSASDTNGNHDTEADNKRILVIGAGLAGLAAARELQSQGHEVQVIEARDRIGGRIWTSTKWPEMPLDLGATWIHGTTNNPLTALADTLLAQRITTYYDKAVSYNTSGKELTTAEESRLEDWREKVFATLELAQEADADVSVKQAIQPLLAGAAEGSEAYCFIHFVLSSEIEQEYSGSTSQLSAHWYDSTKEFKGNDVLFAQGFSVITQYLATNLAIQLNQVVTAIDWSSTPVRVTTRDKVWQADQVIVTIPLGVLQAQSVVFTPALPSTKQNAINKLGMGVLNKCYLRFPYAFWPNDVDWLEYVSAQPGEWTEWVSFQRAANMPILLGFNAADRGKAIEAWSDQQLVANAMQTLRTVYGLTIPDPIDYQITRWASDPFARGSYSFHAIGSTPTMHKQLADPLEKRLFFAGEATDSDYSGTAHGAYLSGLRAAKEVLAARS